MMNYPVEPCGQWLFMVIQLVNIDKSTILNTSLGKHKYIISSISGRKIIHFE